jgi:hypothetical protein
MEAATPAGVSRLTIFRELLFQLGVFGSTVSNGERLNREETRA